MMPKERADHFRTCTFKAKLNIHDAGSKLPRNCSKYTQVKQSPKAHSLVSICHHCRRLAAPSAQTTRGHETSVTASALCLVVSRDLQAPAAQQILQAATTELRHALSHTTARTKQGGHNLSALGTHRWMSSDVSKVEPMLVDEGSPPCFATSTSGCARDDQHPC